MSSTQSVSRNDEANDAYLRDQGRLRKLRAASSALREVLEDEEGLGSVQEIIGTKLILERRAEQIMAVWD